MRLTIRYEFIVVNCRTIASVSAPCPRYQSEQRRRRYLARFLTEGPEDVRDRRRRGSTSPTTHNTLARSESADQRTHQLLPPEIRLTRWVTAARGTALRNHSCWSAEPMSLPVIGKTRNIKNTIFQMSKATSLYSHLCLSRQATSFHGVTCTQPHTRYRDYS